MKVITELVKNLDGSLSHEPNADLGGTAFQIIFLLCSRLASPQGWFLMVF